MFTPDLGLLEPDRDMLARFLDQVAADAPDAVFLAELAAAARADGDSDRHRRPGCGWAHGRPGRAERGRERARAEGAAVKPLMLRVLCEWERFARAQG